MTTMAIMVAVTWLMTAMVREEAIMMMMVMTPMMTLAMMMHDGDLVDEND